MDPRVSRAYRCGWLFGLVHFLPLANWRYSWHAGHRLTPHFRMARISKSKAAKFNSVTLKRLQSAIDNDPEVDLAKLLPLRYSTRLESMRGDTGSSEYIQPLFERATDRFYFQKQQSPPQQHPAKKMIFGRLFVHQIPPISYLPYLSQYCNC